MIEKSRLEELIKQGATIFMIKQQPFIAGVSNFIGIQKETLSKENNIGKDNTLYWKDMGIAELEYLFETHEQAEWQLEFGNITRTETLSLPTWEDVYSKLKNYKESDAYTVRLVDNDFCSLVYVKYDMVSQIVLYTHYEAYDWNATKENYIEACKLCKKLFLGGESDESLCNKE